MNLTHYLSLNQMHLLDKIGITLENKNYSETELKQIESIILQHIREKCIDSQNNTTPEGNNYEYIIDIISDFAYEIDPSKPSLREELEEDNTVELKDGRIGTIIDISNELYTIEVLPSYTTGNIDQDIPIVSVLEIKRKIPQNL